MALVAYTMTHFALVACTMTHQSADMLMTNGTPDFTICGLKCLGRHAMPRPNDAVGMCLHMGAQVPFRKHASMGWWATTNQNRQKRCGRQLEKDAGATAIR